MFDFTFPKNVEVIIYNSRGEEILFDLLRGKRVKCVSPEKRYNIFILFLTFLKLKFSFKGYLEEYIKISKPRLLISNVDNEPFVWNLKHKFSFLSVVVIQFAHRSRVHDLFGIPNISTLFKIHNAHVDYFFVFNKNVIVEYKNLVKSNFLLLGSIKNNYIPLSNQKFSSKKVSFISQYRSNQKHHPIFVTIDGREILKEQFYSSEFKLLPALLLFCEINSFELNIIGCSNLLEEIEFYNSILGSGNYYFISKTTTYGSYELLSQSRLVITVDSTLGYESLARGIKTAFISNRSNDLLEESVRFGWPGKFNDSGPFWINNVEHENILTLLNSLNEMPLNIHQDLVKKYSNELMVFDFNNSVLKTTIDKILI
jgi:surface carbohydrate biosynthesis protein